MNAGITEVVLYPRTSFVTLNGVFVVSLPEGISELSHRYVRNSYYFGRPYCTGVD